ncbi:MAG: hypothetical protein ABIR79_21235, partial [Candidatus Binatia bacterium]
MSNWRSMIAALAVAASPSLVHAATTTDPEPYRYLAVMRGDCEELVLAGRDQTAMCNDELVNVDFGDGRVAFVFTSPAAHGTVVTTFLGRASEQKGLRDYRLEVDAISTATTDGTGQPAIIDEAAVGHCAMEGDPVRERAHFECTVDRKAGGTTSA